MGDIENLDYEKYKKIFAGYRYPLAFVDLDRFDDNIAYVAATQKKTGKSIRVASKSIRSLDLIKRVFEIGKDAYRGILAFTMEEAGYLIDKNSKKMEANWFPYTSKKYQLFSNLTKALYSPGVVSTYVKGAIYGLRLEKYVGKLSKKK